MPVSTERSLTILARMVGSSYGIDVQFGNTPSAYTDGKKVVINHEWATGNEDDAKLLECLVEHEVGGHAVHTKFEAKIRLADAGAPPIARHIYQVMEDLRIETAAAKRARGVARILADGVGVLVARGLLCEPDASQPVPPAACIVNTALLKGRSTFLAGQDVHLATAAATWEAQTVQTFGPIWDDVWNCVAQAPQAKSTDEVVDLTFKVLDILKNELPPEADPSNSQGEPGPMDAEFGEGAGPSDQAQGSGKGPQQKGDKSEPSKPEDGDGDAGDAEPSDGSDGGDAKGAESSGGEADGQQGKHGGSSDKDAGKQKPGPSQAQRDAALDSLAEVESKLPTVDLGDLASKSMNESKTVGNEEGRSPGGGSSGGHGRMLGYSGAKALPRDIQAAALKYNNTITRELEMLLEATDLVDKRIGLNGRFVSSNKLPRVGLRDGRIFKSKRRTEAVSTSVMVVTDISGSTSYGHFTDDRSVSYQTAGLGLMVCFGRLLEKFDVPYCSFVFGSNVLIHKDFDMPWRKAEAAFDFGQAGGGTATGVAMTNAIPILAAQDTERKIMVMITDGDAGDMSVVQAAYNEAREQGVETATIFLGNGSKTAAFLKSRGMPILSTVLHEKVQETAVNSLSNAFF